MRVSPLLKAASKAGTQAPTLASSTSQPPLTWLSSLKGDELREVARLTGIRTAGRKAALHERLVDELPRSVFLEAVPQQQDRGTNQELIQNIVKAQTKANWIGDPRRYDESYGRPSSPRAANEGKLSVLSIDMGVQNLAFAHFEVPIERNKNQSAPPSLVLNAWHRLAVSTLDEGTESSSSEAIDDSSAPLPPKALESSLKQAVPAKYQEMEVDTSLNRQKYANHAYTLITHLVTAYQPTHIIIERQRFRSGSGHAVLEWSLKVGMLEGMLYAVLYTLRKLGGYDYSVYGVDPRAVVRYWGLDEKAVRVLGKGKKQMKMPREKVPGPAEVKKRKVGFIRQRLQEWKNGIASGEIEYTTDTLFTYKKVPTITDVHFKSSSQVCEMVEAFLARLQPSPTRRSRTELDLKKLDDLADCLLQGLTWIEWHALRSRLVREGQDALPRVHQ